MLGYKVRNDESVLQACYKGVVWIFLDQQSIAVKMFLVYLLFKKNIICGVVWGWT